MYSSRVGIDRVDKKRIQRLINSDHFNPALVLTTSEIRLFQQAQNRTAFFAMLFGAKEALSKALGHAVTGPATLKRYEVQLSRTTFSITDRQADAQDRNRYKIYMYQADSSGWLVFVSS